MSVAPPAEVRGLDCPFPAAPSPELPLILLLHLFKAWGQGPSHLSRRKRKKATRRAAREMQWPR